MKFNELSLERQRRGRRVGRGIAAGRGKTAGRGTKGQNARTGNKHRPGFEGGQNPLMQRLPKLRGFTSHRARIEVVYTGQLEQVGKLVDNFTLSNSGLVSSPYVRVKLILKGDIAKPINVKLQAASQTAIAAVQKAGGSFASTPQVGRSRQKAAEQKTS